MQAEQRVTKTAEAFEPVEQAWVPYTIHGAKGGKRTKVEVQPDDRYASVDDVADGAVVFDVSDWRRLDREGRLYWETDPFELVVSEGDAQSIVDAGRDAAKAALYGAVASTLDTDDAERMKVTEAYEAAEPAAGYFDVRQTKVGGPGGAETAS